MPEWLWILIIGGCIMGLVGVIYNSLVGRMGKLECWKEKNPHINEILTRSDHFELCRNNTKELKDFIKEELNDVKIEIRKYNGKK